MSSTAPQTYMYVISFVVGALGVFLIAHNVMDVVKTEAKHRIVQFFFGLIGMVAGALMCYWAGKCMLEFQADKTDTFRSVLPLVHKLIGK